MESSSSTSNKFQESSSKSISEVVKGSHEYTIKGYSLLKKMPPEKFISSDKFQVGGYDWILNFFPARKNPNDNSLFLGLVSDHDDVVEVFVEFTLIDQSEKEKHKVVSFFKSFNPNSPPCGYAAFITTTALENSDFVKDDCLIINCTLGVVKHHAQKPKIIQMPPLDMGNSLKELIESSIDTDIAFEVGEETFTAHKLILAAHSPVFKAQFFGLVGNKDMDKVLIKEVEPSVFKAMLIFIYSDELPLSTPSKMVQNLLSAADRFGLDRLKLFCELRLCEEITTSTLATTLLLAETHHCSNLKTFCLQFVTEPGNLTEVMKSEGFEYLKVSYPSLVLEFLEFICRLKC